MHLRYKNDSSKNSLKSLKKDLNIKNDIKPEPEATSNISVEEDVVSKPPVNDNIASDYNLDEIMSSNEEEYISDEELSQISNEIVVDEDIMDVDEDYDASIMEIFGASEE